MSVQPGTTFAGHRVGRALFVGNGRVYYEALELEPARPVLLCTPDAPRGADNTLRDRFLREFEWHGAMRHPHVLPVLSRGDHDGVEWASLAHVDGILVGDLRRVRGPLTLTQCVELTGQLASALEAAHSIGIVVCDVANQLILVERVGQRDTCYLGSFELARRQGAEATKAARSAAYLTPEEIRGELVDERTDVYALGWFLYWLLTDRTPFEGVPQQVLLAIVESERPRLSEARSGIPVELDRIVARALATRREDRYESPVEFARAASNALGARSL